MELSDLWNLQVVAFAATSTLIVVFMLVVLAVIMRRLRYITSEFDTMRQEMKLLEEGVKTVSESLQGRTANPKGAKADRAD